MGVADKFGLAEGLKLSDARSLTVHIVGASLYEVMGIIKWEYLAHRIPHLTQLVLIFIGPELQEEDESIPTVPPCSACLDKGIEIFYNTFNVRYDEYRRGSDFRDPDMVLVQNCGFAEFDDDCDEPGWEDGWRGLEGLVQLTGAPLIITSYTLGEAEKDLDMLLKYTKEDLDVLVRCRQNDMRSRWPIRDWELDQDNDLFYANQYYSVVRAKL